MPPRPLAQFAVFLMLLGVQTKPTQAQIPVCKSPKILAEAVRTNPAFALMELKGMIPDIQYELRYAGTNNFVGKAMYPTQTQHTYLRREPAQALQNVQAELAVNGLGLKIWDAYRPYSVTVSRTTASLNYPRRSYKIVNY